MKIEWRNRYVEDGQLEPDEMNRWQCVGYLWSKESEFHPETTFAKYVTQPPNKKGYIRVEVAVIEQKGCRNARVPSTIHKFACRWLHVDNNSFSPEYYVYGNTVEEVQKQIEDKLNRVFNFLVHAL